MSIFGCCRLVIAGALSLISAGAHGNGAMAEFSAGGVEFHEAVDVAIEREELFLSREEVRVRYIFRSVTGEALNATMGFPMPPAEREINVVFFEFLDFGD